MNAIYPTPDFSPRLRSGVLAWLAALMLTASSAGAQDWGVRQTDQSYKQIIGAWYLSVDVGAIDPALEGLSLSGLAHFHADGTFMTSDANDFGLGGLASSPQYGAWAASRGPDRPNNRVVGTTLFLVTDAVTGEAIGWQKVRLFAQVVDPNLVEGTINAFALLCDDQAPAGTTFNCPDPIENADGFTRSLPPNVPITLKRIVPGS